MLQSDGQPHDTRWLKAYHQNSRSVPHIIIQKSSRIHTRKSTLSASVKTNLYQIVFDKIQNIPVPTTIIQEASRENSKIGCRLSVTLFDMDAGVFFGKTWHSPIVIPVIANIDKQDQVAYNKTEDIDSYRANLVGNRLVIQLRNQFVYFHTHFVSGNLCAVIEINFESIYS